MGICNTEYIKNMIQGEPSPPLYHSDAKLSKYPCISTTGVPLSPLPEVKSQREPSRSVILLGVVPKDSSWATKFLSFFYLFSL